jgi:hypothetical protein
MTFVFDISRGEHRPDREFFKSVCREGDEMKTRYNKSGSYVSLKWQSIYTTDDEEHLVKTFLNKEDET